MDKQRIMELAQELASVPDNDTGYAKHYILEDIENELNEKLEDKNMRILEGWTDEERKELEEAKDSGFLSVITLFCSIKRDDNNCHVLYGKYYREDTNGNNQMARDIADYYAGVAKFPDKKYYVKLIRNDDDGYLNKGKLNTFVTLGNCRTSHYYQTEFTKQEIKAIDPRYLAFAVLVEDDDE